MMMAAVVMMMKKIVKSDAKVYAHTKPISRSRKFLRGVDCGYKVCVYEIGRL